MIAMTGHGESSPPPFLQLAGHPLRWRLLSELAHSDRRVGELCELADVRSHAVPQADVLFLCTGNSARSQMAEALAEQLSGGAVRAASAGSHPKPLHTNAVRVMRERGVDLAGHRPKHLSEFSRRRFDYVISLCDRVREVCPEYPGGPELIHWSIPDPARQPGSDEQTLPAFERTAAELHTRIEFLIEAIESTTTTREVTERA